ncbi:MAG TPA: AraC family transcriptional regulator [Bacteroidales bacterium]|nr:AraC family transcriptional regulator [Bacteroidales bacterium]
MITYRILSEKNEEVLSLNFFDKSISGTLEEKHVSNVLDELGYYEYSVVSDKNIGVLWLKYKSGSDMLFRGEIHGSVIEMCFMLKGNAHYDCKDVPQKKMHQHSNNIFYLNNPEMSYHVSKETNFECVKIFVSEEALCQVATSYPDVMDDFLNKVNRRASFELGLNHFVTTASMVNAIHDIEKWHFMGICSRMYLELKVLELFAMQMDQYMPVKLTPQFVSMSRHRHKIEKARAILEERFLSPPTITGLAREVGTNSTQLKSGFRFFYNCGVYKYLSIFRINKACELLHDVNMSIAEVAEHSGFEHQSHFTTAFKKLCGISPLEYRKKAIGAMKVL